MPPRITFAGLGNMGAALVRAHLEAGSVVTIWNRTIDKPIVSSLEEQGAQAQGDFIKAITASDYLVLCLVDHESIHKILDSLPNGDSTVNALSKLKAVVNLTSGSPDDATTMRDWFIERHAAVYVDGAILAGPDNIGADSSIILYGGDIPSSLSNDIENLIPVLGRSEYVGGGTGTARTLDNAVLAATYGMMNGLMLSTAILTKARSKQDSQNSQYVSKAVRKYVNPLLRAAVEENEAFAQSLEDDNNDAQGSAVSMLTSSMRNLMKTCEEMKVDGKPLRSFFELCNEVVEDGNGSQGMTLVAKKLMHDA